MSSENADTTLPTSDSTASLTSSSSVVANVKVRCLVQQCVKSKLQVRLPDPENNVLPEFVEINRGIVLFVCFLKDAQESDVDKLVKSVLNVKLTELDDGKHVSILDFPGSILIIPQATLGGKAKGKLIQYHNNINKDKGLELYEKFIELCKKYSNENEKWKKNENCKIVHGTYGIRQVYSTETNGPYLHLIEF